MSSARTHDRPQSERTDVGDRKRKRSASQILGKRDFSFNNFSVSTHQKIMMDLEASYSVTQMDLAGKTSQEFP